ncbi:hypothetical protein BV898_14345 [Hypsibius exemplaris]|uniref:G-protein coupled receptors family 1 profile domain-containing protein n=1 Tax=Hypsibius exemplaris TaxID=2072580 RepID=A0A9X6N9D4_HYPEX|nr:hypothetical protein BV898_14345 [Hypsibius exemplaris]
MSLNSSNNVTFQDQSAVDTNSTVSWTVASVFSIVTFTIGLLGNAVLLLLFIADRALRAQPFNVYLVNLLLANLGVILIQYPMDIITNLHSSQWVLGEPACTAYMYAVFILEAASENAHQLIALNRIWAAVSPVSYRSAHASARTAVVLSAGVWVYVHVVMGPGWIGDALYYRLPVTTNGCQMNLDGMPIYGWIVQLFIYELPLLTMIAAFPIILCVKTVRRRARLKKRSARIRPASESQSMAVQPVASHITDNRNIRSSRYAASDALASRSPLAPRAGSHAAASKAESQLAPQAESQLAPRAGSQMAPRAESQLAPRAGSQLAPQAESQLAPQAESQLAPRAGSQLAPRAESQLAPRAESQLAPRAESQLAPRAGSQLAPRAGLLSRRKSHRYLLLAMLIASVVVCWTPIDVYYRILMFYPNFYIPEFYQTATILFSFQTALDPIAFTFALDNVRASLVQRLFFLR